MTSLPERRDHLFAFPGDDVEQLYRQLWLTALGGYRGSPETDPEKHACAAIAFADAVVDVVSSERAVVEEADEEAAYRRAAKHRRELQALAEQLTEAKGAAHVAALARRFGVADLSELSGVSFSDLWPLYCELQREVLRARAEPGGSSSGAA